MGTAALGIPLTKMKAFQGNKARRGMVALPAIPQEILASSHLPRAWVLGEREYTVCMPKPRLSYDLPCHWEVRETCYLAMVCSINNCWICSNYGDLVMGASVYIVFLPLTHEVACGGMPSVNLCFFHSEKVLIIFF